MCFSYLNEHLAQEGHDKGGVHAAEAPDGADGQLSDLKHLVVQRHKQRLQVLGLGQVSVKAFIKRCQHAVSNVWIYRRSQMLKLCHYSCNIHHYSHHSYQQLCLLSSSFSSPVMLYLGQ